MKIDIITLFPNMFNGFLSESIIKRAIDDNKITINIHNLRDYSTDKHKKVDDYPFGGGHGMILMCQPVFDAVEALKTSNSKVIMMTPSGKVFDQQLALNLSKEKHLIIICGHYEGFDERIRTIVDMEISIGDYILTGGELPSMVITDAIVRLIDGVINQESLATESFNDNLLDYPNYTQPRDFKGLTVPHVLLSGNHQKIEEWRQNERIKRTKEKRPDLLEK
ncbi:MAG: tRNA (guanosine(37)-N1)-methyltransferase TrmD [Bacilli bacterium]|jgi:tRNA (guanine37-N1)-methyltransferase